MRVLLVVSFLLGVLFVFWPPYFSSVFFGGLKGHVRWPEGPPHLALNPPYFVCCFVFFLCFLLCKIPKPVVVCCCSCFGLCSSSCSCLCYCFVVVAVAHQSLALLVFLGLLLFWLA